jgi:PAS domain-containing protein
VGSWCRGAEPSRPTQDAFIEAKGRRAEVLAGLLARQLSGPVAEGDWESVDVIVRAEGEHNPWVELVLPDGRVHRAGMLRMPPGLHGEHRPSAVTVRSGTEEVVDVTERLAGGAIVHVGVSLEPARAASLEVVRMVIVSSLAAMLAGAIAIGLVATLLTRRLRGLAVAARKMGREDVHVATEGGDEIAELGRSFDEMSREVRARIAQSEDLRAYFESVLDEMPSAVVVCDGSGDSRYANREARSLLGQRGDDLPSMVR